MLGKLARAQWFYFKVRENFLSPKLFKSVLDYGSTDTSVVGKIVFI